MPMVVAPFPAAASLPQRLPSAEDMIVRNDDRAAVRPLALLAPLRYHTWDESMTTRGRR
jgi:hypothetical protein